MRFFITLLFAFAYLFAYAQPANDDCTGVIDLGVAPYCPDAVFFSNVGATASDIGFGNSPSCFNGGLAENDVWFSFIASDTILDYTITVTGLSDGTDPPLTNPQIALYRGECMVDGLAELLCVSAEEGATEVELDANGLTPNVPYFIRISDYSATATPNEGSFQICVEELEPINTIDQMSSTACTGELYDSGGPDGDYQNNEDFTFTICPQELTNCINFSLQYYNLGLDNLTFYDGDDTNAPIIGSVGGASVAGSGGVCYEVQASSGCLTVQFQSDATATFEGFAGSWACSAQACEEAVPLAVASGVTEEEIIDFITTPQTVVTITDITCSENSYGTFTATDQTGLGLERGLLLTTGTLDWAIGPNDDDGFGNVAGGLGLPGDDDLDVLSEQGGVPLPSQDACVISLDVFAATNELTFEYIFASEEYPEFVGGGFNDIFAFLISGPGIAGNPAIDNQLNIAALPDGTPVQIDDINSDTNWEYYRDNSGGQSIQYDGLTSDFLGIKKSLTARAQVQPCSTYQLKLAIADRGDDLFDSGVFISELKGGSPSVSIKFNSGIDYLIEDCTTLPDEIVIALNNTLEDTVTYNINLGGTAELGIDYDLELPSSITFLPGEQEFIFPITVLSDLLDESTELITIALSNDFGCGEVTLTTLEIPLEDVLDIQIAAGQDTVYLCTDEVAELSVEGAANYFWSPVSIFDDPFITNPVASPDSSQLVFVEGSVGQCTAVDSVYLQQIDPVLAINPLSPPAICEGDSVTLQVTNNANNQGFAWEENELISDPTAPTITIAPTSTEVFTANLDLSGCVTSDSLEIVVDSFTFPMVAADTVICQNYSVQLATQEPGLVTTTYEWSPANGLSDPTDPEAIATPEVTTTYTLIAMSASELCADTADIQLTVTPVDVAIQNPDTTLLCKGESVDLQAITNTGLSTGLVWNADPTLSDSIGLVVTATPEISTSYLATFALGDCVVFDSVLVQVDSLPATLPIMPLDTSVCEGSLVLLTS
ncbi:MAG: choice-of-anchor L domain-containing protein, partial [Bacteroidota bacterium]